MQKPNCTLTVEGVYVGSKGTHISVACDEIIFDFEGIVGDRHHGFLKQSDVRQKPFYVKGTTIRNSRPWSIVSVEELSQIGQAMGVIIPLKPEWLSANLLVSGYEYVTQLPVGTKLVFPEGDVHLVVHEENNPCIWPGNTMAAEEPAIPPHIAEGFVQAALKRRGLVGWVEKPGVVKAGDILEVYAPLPWIDRKKFKG